MKLSLLNQLSTSQNEADEPNYFTFNEVPSVKYEQIDQLRCYIDLAVLFEEEYHELLSVGKEQFLENYEQVIDIIGSDTKKMFNIFSFKPYINIGLDLYEFLQNSLIIKRIVVTENISVNDLKELFGNVCTNSEEITNKFICLLMFFELVDINDNNTSIVDISKFIYACSLYETTLNTNEQSKNNECI